MKVQLRPLRRGFLWSCLTLTTLSTHAELTDTIARIKSSVVIVGTYKELDSPRFRLRGTGFVVGGGSQVITNLHVLPDVAEVSADMRLVVQVRLADNKLDMRSATVTRTDRIHDLALLQMSGPPVPAMVIRDSGTVREGQAVAFMGFPIGGALGYSIVTHRGTVSSIAPMALPAPNSRSLSAAAIRGAREDSFNIFQLDGTAYPGNSGGPLFDPMTGELLGVVNMVFVKGARESALTHPSGISYAIPSRFVSELLAERR